MKLVFTTRLLRIAENSKRKAGRALGLLRSVKAMPINNAARKRFISEISGISNIAIIGSGPSVDCAPLEELRDHAVFFMNHSIDLINRFDSSNKFFWFSADKGRVVECKHKCKAAIFRLVAVHDYRNFTEMHTALGSDALYLLPKINWRSAISRLNFSSIRVDTPDTIDFPDIDRTLFIPYILGGTSALPLLALVLSLRPSLVQIFGVDVSVDIGSHAVGVDIPVDGRKSGGFNPLRVEKMIAKIITESRNESDATVIKRWREGSVGTSVSSEFV